MDRAEYYTASQGFSASQTKLPMASPLILTITAPRTSFRHAHHPALFIFPEMATEDSEMPSLFPRLKI
jgi:hypothetical protein